MRLNTLQLTNFRQHADTRIEFDIGLTGIFGHPSIPLPQTAPADAHARQSLVPTGDQVGVADVGDRERLLAVDARVELQAGVQPAGVVDGDAVADLHDFACARHLVAVVEAGARTGHLAEVHIQRRRECELRGVERTGLIVAACAEQCEQQRWQKRSPGEADCPVIWCGILMFHPLKVAACA